MERENKMRTFGAAVVKLSSLPTAPYKQIHLDNVISLIAFIYDKGETEVEDLLDAIKEIKR